MWKIIILHVLFLGIASEFVVEQLLSDDAIQEVYNQLKPAMSKWTIYKQPNDRSWSVVATEPINRGEPIMSIQSDLALSSFDEFPLRETLKYAPDEVILAGRLIYERYVNTDLENFLNMYVHTFPVEVSSAVNWTETDVEILEEEAFLPYDMELPIPVNKGWEMFKFATEALGELWAECWEYQTWVWAYLTVLSRSFTQSRAAWVLAQGDTPEEIDSMIYGAAIYPLFDLANHAPEPLEFEDDPQPIVHVPESYHGYVMLADKDYLPGQEITWSYGTKSNIDLLYGYGFVLDKNLYETFPVDTKKIFDCPEEEFGTKVCRFNLGVSSLSWKLLWYRRVVNSLTLQIPEEISPWYLTTLPEYGINKKRESQESLMKSIGEYRAGIQGYLFVCKKLRRQRRAHEISIQLRYSIAQIVAAYEHLKLLDRFHLSVLYTDILDNNQRFKMSFFPTSGNKTLLLPSVLPQSDIPMTDILKRLEKTHIYKKENSHVRRLKRTKLGYSRPNQPLKSYPKSVKNANSMEIKPINLTLSREVLPKTNSSYNNKSERTSHVKLRRSANRNRNNMFSSVFVPRKLHVDIPNVNNKKRDRHGSMDFSRYQKSLKRIVIPLKEKKSIEDLSRWAENTMESEDFQLFAVN